MSPDALMEAIRLAVAADASDDVRSVGANACRTLLAVLETKPGDVMAPTAPTQATSVAQLVGVLRDVPPDQLLDMVIGRLRAALPAEIATPQVQPVTFQLVKLPPIRRG